MSYEFLSVFFEGILIVAGFIIIFFLVVRKDAKDKEIDKLGQYSQRVQDYEKRNGYDPNMRKKLLSDKEELNNARAAYEESLQAKTLLEQEFELIKKKGIVLLYKYQDVIFTLFSKAIKKNKDGLYYSATIVHEGELYDAFQSEMNPSETINELINNGVISQCPHDRAWYELDTLFLYGCYKELSIIGVNYSQWIEDHYSTSEIENRLKPNDYKPYEFEDNLPF